MRVSTFALKSLTFILFVEPILSISAEEKSAAGFNIQHESVSAPRPEHPLNASQAGIKVTYHFENHNLEMFQDTLFHVKNRFEDDPFEAEEFIVWEPVDPKAFDIRFSDSTQPEEVTEPDTEIHFAKKPSLHNDTKDIASK